jgi:protein-tyrosine kinase
MLGDVAAKNTAAVAAYRILRTRILQRARLRQWTTIGVTSACANDGKSLTALNLSLSLAREGNSEVVLLDLDMRSPAICPYLGIEPVCHLRDYFEGTVGAEDVFFSIGVDNLLLAAGDVRANNASELLGTQQLDALIEYIKQHTQTPIVLIDLPPLLSTDDALVVVPKIDATLLVVAEGRTDRAALNKAMELLSDVPLAGVVLNQSIETGQGYDYGYGAPHD